ncbi:MULTISPECIES: hypothetical protein [unclassified Kribbella]|uniref:hypothetical protein n=1 Tax=unclassified Kribbella TaxID=2644121 RepID=UPI0033EEFF15
MPALLYRAAIHDVRGTDVLPLNRLRNLKATEPLLPWADIPHILHRGPLAISLFRDAGGRPVSV